MHMFLWVADLPNEITEQTIPVLTDYIDKTIFSTFPDEKDDTELNALVKRHHSTSPFNILF